MLHVTQYFCNDNSRRRSRQAAKRKDGDATPPASGAGTDEARRATRAAGAHWRVSEKTEKCNIM